MTEEQNKLAEEIERQADLKSAPQDGTVSISFAWHEWRDVVEALREREPATDAVRLTDFVNAADIGGADAPHVVVEKLQAAIDRALKGKGASQGEGLSVHEADIIAAAVQLAPLLEEGWDEYDAPEDQNEGARACDALIKAVNAMLQAPDEQKG